MELLLGSFLPVNYIREIKKINDKDESFKKVNLLHWLYTNGHHGRI